MKPFHFAEKLKLSNKIRDYLSNPNWQVIDQALLWAEQENQIILTTEDKRYPKKLKQIPDLPAILFIKGNIKCLQDPQVAIVGSRYPSHYGKDCAYQFAKTLSDQGLCITSGLAMGIDTAAHEGALVGASPTIAILGTGLNQIYPTKNKKLADNIIAHGGAIVSEFPLEMAPLKHHFPRRNRIISGLSLGTLVVEAAAQSGSLITARKAMEQGREVFAIPGSIHSPHSKGSHQIIREGAKLVESAYDILIEIKPALRPFLKKDQIALDLTSEKNTTSSSGSTEGSSISSLRGATRRGNLDQKLDPAVKPHDDERVLPEEKLDSDYQSLLNNIDFTATPTDLIIVRSQLTASEVSSMLLRLELKQFIVSVSGGYARVK